MQFKDELNASIKTPQQVAKELDDATVRIIKEDVQRDISALKNALKANASKGEYIDFDTCKVIIAHVSTYLRKYYKIHIKTNHEKRGFFGRDIHTYHIVTCNYSDSKYAQFYLDEINRVAQEDGIECKIIAEYKDGNYSCHWDIPSTKRLDIFSVAPYHIRICIRGSITI